MDDPDSQADRGGPPATDRDDAGRGAAADRPRLRISLLMIAVALAALNFGVIRVYRALWVDTGSPTGGRLPAKDLIIWATAMVRFLGMILFVHLWNAIRGRWSRSSFAWKGSRVAALILCSVVSGFPLERLLGRPLGAALDRLQAGLGPDVDAVLVVLYGVGVVALVLPLVVVTLFGRTLARLSGSGGSNGSAPQPKGRGDPDPPHLPGGEP